MLTRHKALSIAVAIVSIIGLEGCGKNPAGSQDQHKEVCPVIRQVSLSVTESVTWYPDTVYIITDNDFWVSDNVTLTILPGTVIKIVEGYKIRVSGTNARIIAEGTSDSMIVFTSANDNEHGCETNPGALPDSGDWGYISAKDDCRFSWCKFLYGGGKAPVWSGALRTSDSAAYVTNCVFAHNANIALNAGYTLTDATIKNNLFYGNEIPLEISAGITLYDNDGNRFDTTLGDVLVSNDKNGVFVNSYAGSGNPLTMGENQNIQWGITIVPYVMQHEIVIAEKNILQVMDQVTVKAKSGGRIRFKYTTNNLYVAKSAVFTSFLDDTRSGDTNGDGNATQPAAGDWNGISGSNTAANPTSTPWVENSIIHYDADHTGQSQEYEFPIPKI